MSIQTCGTCRWYEKRLHPETLKWGETFHPEEGCCKYPVPMPWSNPGYPVTHPSSGILCPVYVRAEED